MRKPARIPSYDERIDATDWADELPENTAKAETIFSSLETSKVTAIEPIADLATKTVLEKALTPRIEKVKIK